MRLEQVLMPDPAAEARLAKVAARYRKREADYEAARRELLEAMVEARTTLTFERIAEIVGMSRQRVMQLLRSKK